MFRLRVLAAVRRQHGEGGGRGDGEDAGARLRALHTLLPPGRHPRGGGQGHQGNMTPVVVSPEVSDPFLFELSTKKVVPYLFLLPAY